MQSKKSIRQFLITALVILAGAGATLTADAQIRWGVRGGADFSKFPTTPEQFDSEYYTGFHIGPTAELDLPLGFSLDASLLFAKKNVGLTMAETKVKDILKTNYFTVPVNAKFDLLSLPLAKLMVIAGPQFNFMLSNNLEELPEALSQQQKIEAQKMSMGINIGLGVQVLEFLQISALYNATLSDDYKFTGVSETMEDVFNAKTNSFLIQAAVLF